MDHLKRLVWPIIGGIFALGFALALGVQTHQLEAVVFKFLIFCPSLALVHLSRIALFPYIDLSFCVAHVLRDAAIPAAIRDAAVTLGVFLYYVGMTAILVGAIS